MSDIVISTENVSKKYVLRRAAREQEGLRHAIEKALRNPLKWFGQRKDASAARRDEFWALRDVSFEIRAGEALGVIGRNGAGKSTLLKVLSRITEPTTGRIRIKGRVASLLEVGTGFHQELTGRENIFLNGAILGMTRSEVKRKFDEIVAFAEVERFLDTPVKHYSSGMYVRLAFSVAAHLEPDILIVDEVLAVGDSQFQSKCIGKMEDVASIRGRTVLFVSHNMGVITRLCNRSFLFDKGRLTAVGPTSEVITRYLSSGAEANGIKIWPAPEDDCAAEAVRPREIRILDEDGNPTGHVGMTRQVTIELKYEILEKVPMFRVAFRFFTADGTLAFMGADSSSASFDAKPTTPGQYVCRCVLPSNLLNEGQYYLTVSGDVPFQKVLFHEDAVISFLVEQTGGMNSRFPEKWPGAVCPSLEWSTRRSGRNYDDALVPALAPGVES